MMIDTSPGSIRIFFIIVLSIVWVYILNNPTTDILDGYVKNDYKNLDKIIFVGEEDEANNIFSDILEHSLRLRCIKCSIFNSAY